MRLTKKEKELLELFKQKNNVQKEEMTMFKSEAYKERAVRILMGYNLIYKSPGGLLLYRESKLN